MKALEQVFGVSGMPQNFGQVFEALVEQVLHVFEPVHEGKDVLRRDARKLRQEVHDGRVVLLGVELVCGVDRHPGGFGRVGLFAAFLQFLEKFAGGMRTENRTRLALNSDQHLGSGGGCRGARLRRRRSQV